MSLCVGVVGLGTMGAPMARHLIEAGHQVVVWNRTGSKADALVRLGAGRASSPAGVADGADAVLTCVSDDPDLEAVVFGPDGVASTLPGGAVLVDCRPPRRRLPGRWQSGSPSRTESSSMRPFLADLKVPSGGR